MRNQKTNRLPKLLRGVIRGKKDDGRLRQLIPLWLERPENNRDEDDVLTYYGWLEENRPELLKRRSGDPYQQLKLELRNFTRDVQL